VGRLHTYATRLYAFQTHPRAVQELLGHTQITTSTGTYTASVPEVLREAADALDGTFVKVLVLEDEAVVSNLGSNDGSPLGPPAVQQTWNRCSRFRT
jgi:hypothetical protein